MTTIIAISTRMMLKKLWDAGYTTKPIYQDALNNLPTLSDGYYDPDVVNKYISNLA